MRPTGERPQIHVTDRLAARQIVAADSGQVLGASSRRLHARSEIRIHGPETIARRIYRDPKHGAQPRVVDQDLGPACVVDLVDRTVAQRAEQEPMILAVVLDRFWVERWPADGERLAFGFE